jgi:hypothetical protein
MSMLDDLDARPGNGVTTVWNGSEWVPVVDPREAPTFVRDTRSDRRVLLPVVTAVLTLGLVLGGVGHALVAHAGVVGDPGTTVVGTVDLVDLDTSAHDCRGSGPYADVRTGTPVTLTDDRGTVLATAELEAPHAFGDAGCIYPFRLAHVPTTRGSYVVTLPHGDTLVSSRAALEAADWTLRLSLDRARSAS